MGCVCIFWVIVTCGLIYGLYLLCQQRRVRIVLSDCVGLICGEFVYGFCQVFVEVGYGVAGVMCA